MDESLVLAVIIILLGFATWMILKILPVWKELKLSEHATRKAEAESEAKRADSMGQLANAINLMSKMNGTFAATLKDIAVEQRRATEEVRILQRVASDQNNKMATQVESVTEWMVRIKERIKMD